MRRPDIITYRIFGKRGKTLMVSWISIPFKRLLGNLNASRVNRRMWGVSGTVVLGVQLDIEAEKHLQILEHLGTMETANDIVHLEGRSTGLMLW